MTHDVALFIPIAEPQPGDELLSTVYGSPQSGSFGIRLSAGGQEPATHLGTYARSLDEGQYVLLEGQSAVAWFEGAWLGCLVAAGLQQIPTIDD
jgi:hypothetical protein